MSFVRPPFMHMMFMSRITIIRVVTLSKTGYKGDKLLMHRPIYGAAIRIHILHI